MADADVDAKARDSMTPRGDVDQQRVGYRYALHALRGFGSYTQYGSSAR
jgi:hypothetical protein